jgi:hypothetical protein
MANLNGKVTQVQKLAVLDQNLRVRRLSPYTHSKAANHHVSEGMIAIKPLNPKTTSSPSHFIIPFNI